MSEPEVELPPIQFTPLLLCRRKGCRATFAYHHKSCHANCEGISCQCREFIPPFEWILIKREDQLREALQSLAEANRTIAALQSQTIRIDHITDKVEDLLWDTESPRSSMPDA